MANNDAASGGLFRLFPQKTNDYALEYMNSKYGQEFSYLGPWGDSMTGTRSFLASCKTLPDQRILVQVENFRDEDNRRVRDNYLACLYVEETTAFIRGCAEDTLGSVMVYYDPSMRTLSPELPADASFEQFLAESGVRLIVLIEVKGSQWQNEDQARAFAQRLADSGASGNVNVIAVEDEQFGTLSLEQLKDRIAVHNFVRYALISFRDGKCDLDFREGTA